MAVIALAYATPTTKRISLRLLLGLKGDRESGSVILTSLYGRISEPDRHLNATFASRLEPSASNRAKLGRDLWDRRTSVPREATRS